MQFTVRQYRSLQHAKVKVLQSSRTLSPTACTLLSICCIRNASDLVAMASVKSAASSVVLGFLGLYLILWNTMKTVLGGLYGALRTLSGIYPPANHFLTNLEKTMHRLKTDPSVCAELNLQSLLQEFWSPATLLEGLVSSDCSFVFAYFRSLSGSSCGRKLVRVLLAAGSDLRCCPGLDGRPVHHG